MKKNTNIEELDELRRSRDFLKGVIDNIGDPTLVIDADYHILFANKALQKIYDGRDPVAEHLNCYQVVHRLERPCPVVCPGTYPCPLEKVFSTRVPVKVTHIHHDSLDNEVFVEVIGSPIFDESGNVVRIVESLRNITERKREGEKLENLILDLQGALAKIKRLSGLLPVCMSCKRIRSDKGEWKNIEAYIRDHSDAEFTHSLCPECEKKLYDFERDRKGNDK